MENTNNKLSEVISITLIFVQNTNIKPPRSIKQIDNKYFIHASLVQIQESKYVEKSLNIHFYNNRVAIEFKN